MKKNKLPAVKKSVKSRYIRFFRKKLHDGTFFFIFVTQVDLNFLGGRIHHRMFPENYCSIVSL